MKDKTGEGYDMLGAKDALNARVSGRKHLDREALMSLAATHSELSLVRQRRIADFSRAAKQYWLAALVPAAALAVVLLAGLPGMRSRKSALEAAILTAEMVIPASTEWVTGAFSGAFQASYMDDYIEDLWGSDTSGIIF